MAASGDELGPRPGTDAKVAPLSEQAAAKYVVEPEADGAQARKETAEADAAFIPFPDDVLETIQANPGTKRRASVISRVFTSLQDEGHHLSVWISGILFLAENPGIDKLRGEIGRRFLNIPRFRSKVTIKLPSAPSYFTELDPAEIDMNYHITSALDGDDAPPTKDAVLKYATSMYENWEPDLEKPLWQILIVPCVAEGGSAIIFRVSHAVGDGVSQIEVFMRMLDPEDRPDPKAKGQRPPKSRTQKRRPVFGPLTKSRLFVYGIYQGLTSIFRGSDPPNSLQHGAAVPKSLKRKYAFTEKLDVDRVKAISQKLEGSTINDVLLLVLNESLHRYFQENKEESVLNGARVMAQFPASTRRRGSGAFRKGDPCNRIAYCYIKFRFRDGGSMIDRFWRIKRDVDKIKLSPAPLVGVAVVRSLVPFLSRKGFNKLGFGIFDRATAQLSNVVAPQKPVHIAGARVDDMTFILFAPITLYLGLLSYNGKVNCGICLDGELQSDPGMIAKHWLPVFEDFEKEVMAREGEIQRLRYFLDLL